MKTYPLLFHFIEFAPSSVPPFLGGLTLHLCVNPTKGDKIILVLITSWIRVNPAAGAESPF